MKINTIDNKVWWNCFKQEISKTFRKSEVINPLTIETQFQRSFENMQIQ